MKSLALSERPDSALLDHNIEQWILDREENLLYTANEIKNGGGISKLVGLGGLALSVFLGGMNPLAPLAAVLCGAGYLGAVLQDKAITNSFALLPFMRGNITDTLATAFNADLRLNYERGTEIDELKDYLPFKERYELVMLTTQKLEIIDHLSSAPFEKRENMYFWMVNKFIEGTHHQKAFDIKTEIFTLVESEEDNFPEIVPPSLPAPSVSPAVFPTPQPSVVRPGNDLKPMFDNAYKIRDSLVRDAANSVLNGTIIISKPGGGKTTFLGSAWGQLQEQYGDRFESFAVVMKKSDVAAFQGCSTHAYCASSNTVEVFVEVLKFIESALADRNKISRIFLDDFLTMTSRIEVNLKGVFINPDTYDVAYKKTADYVNLLDELWAKLNEVWLVGRETNTALWVSSHSANVDSLPFLQGGRDARSVGRLIYLAKSTENEFIEQVLNNPNLIGDNRKRDVLKQQMSKVGKVKEPIILSNADNWTFGVIPQAIYEEYQAYRRVWNGEKLTPVDDLTAQAFHHWVAHTFPQGVHLTDAKLLAYLQKINVGREQLPVLVQTLKGKQQLDFLSPDTVKAL